MQFWRECQDAASEKCVYVAGKLLRTKSTIWEDRRSFRIGQQFVIAGAHEIEAGATEGRWVARQLRRPMVKAFNNIHVRHLMDLGKPARAPGRMPLPVAGESNRLRL